MSANKAWPAGLSRSSDRQRERVLEPLIEMEGVIDGHRRIEPAGPLKTATRAAIKSPSPPATAKGAHSGPGIRLIERLERSQNDGHQKQQAIASTQTDARGDEPLKPQPPKDPCHRLFQLAHRLAPITEVLRRDRIGML